MLDIGANIGNHALFLARHCSAVHCYEPNPRVLRRLERNIELNGAENIIVHGFGLGEDNEIATFHENVDGNVGASSFVKPFGDCREVQLPIRNAGEAVAELHLDRLDLVKVDVEGMEETVFRALLGTINRFKPAIAFEFRGQLEDVRGFDEIRSLLSGYQIYEAQFSPAEGSFFARIAWNLRKAGMPDLVPVQKVEPRAYENLVALPA